MSEELENFAARVRACRICVENPVGQPLPHEPRPVLRPSSSARILIASQAPGTKVHMSGMPFTDASGDRLRELAGGHPRRILRHDEIRHRADGLLLSRPGCQGRRPAAAPRMCSGLACAADGADAAYRPGADDRPLCAILAHGRCAPALADGNGDGLAHHLECARAPKVLPLPHPSWRNTGWLKRNPWFEMDLLPFLRSEIRYRLG